MDWKRHGVALGMTPARGTFNKAGELILATVSPLVPTPTRYTDGETQLRAAVGKSSNSCWAVGRVTRPDQLPNGIGEAPGFCVKELPGALAVDYSGGDRWKGRAYGEAGGGLSELGKGEQGANVPSANTLPRI